MGWAVLATVLLASASFAQPSAPSVDRLLRPADASFYHTPVGLCEDYPEESTTLDIIRGDLEVLRRSGVNVLRISFGWDGIEAEKDVYDWMFWDDFVRLAVDDYGITLIPYICYTPLWNASNKDPNEAWHSPPVDYDEFGEFMEDLVNRYKDRIKTWEIWNEPDISIFWAGTHAEYARLLKMGSAAVRRADPEALVVLGGIAHDPEWLRYLLRDHDVSGEVDIINMHNYYETWQGYPMEQIADYVNTVHDVVHRYGDGQPLWMAEVGYSSYRKDAHVSDQYTAYYEYEHSAAYQAVDLVRRLVKVLSTEKLSAVTWYELKDLPPVGETIGDVNNRHLGIVRQDHTPKPAERALTFFTRLTAEPMRSLDRESIIERPVNSDAHVHVFEQEDGDLLVAGWLQTRVPGAQPDPGEGLHVDARSESLMVTIPRAVRGEIAAYDAVGNLRETPEVERGQHFTRVTLDLMGGDVVVLQLQQ